MNKGINTPIRDWFRYIIMYLSIHLSVVDSLIH